MIDPSNIEIISVSFSAFKQASDILDSMKMFLNGNASPLIILTLIAPSHITNRYAKFIRLNLCFSTYLWPFKISKNPDIK